MNHRDTENTEVAKSRSDYKRRHEGLELLIHRYEKAGLYDISRDSYLGGRHEMLNEINREEVRERLLAWIASVLERAAYGPTASTVA